MIFISESSVPCFKNIKYDFRAAGNEAGKEDSFPSERMLYRM